MGKTSNGGSEIIILEIWSYTKVQKTCPLNFVNILHIFTKTNGLETDGKSEISISL